MKRVLIRRLIMMTCRNSTLHLRFSDYIVVVFVFSSSFSRPPTIIIIMSDQLFYCCTDDNNNKHHDKLYYIDSRSPVVCGKLQLQKIENKLQW